MQKSTDLIEQIKNSDEIFKGELLHAFKDTAILPDGNTSTREWIKHPGACAIVPIFENGDIMMIQQYRYPLKEVCWEIPAGKIDPGEDIAVTAERELLEEAGLKTNDLIYIGKFYPCVGYSDEVIHIYAARDLELTEMNTDHDEFLIRERVPFSKAIDMIDNHEIPDGKTVICLLRVWRWLNDESTS